MKKEKAPEMTPEQQGSLLVQKLEGFVINYCKSMMKDDKQKLEAFCELIVMVDFPPQVLFAMSKRVLAISFAHDKPKNKIEESEQALCREIIDQMKTVSENMRLRSGINEDPETVKPRVKHGRPKSPNKKEK